MSTLDAFRNSDTLSISALAYDYVIRAEVYENSGRKQIGNQCIQKQIGSLSLQVSASQLGFASYPITLTLNGSDVGLDSSGRQLVEWNIDEHPNVYVKKADVTLRSVTGRIRVILHPIPKALSGTSCDGFSRSLTSHLEAVPAESSLVFKGERKVAPLIWVDGTLEATNLTFTAEAGEPSALQVKIEMLDDECGVGAVVGGAASFRADVAGAPKGESLKYKWSVTGAIATGSDDRSFFHVALPSLPTPVTVSLVVSVVSESARGTFDFRPLTIKEYAWVHQLCKMKMMVHRTFLADPLWDPIRDLVAHPYSRDELQSALATVERLAADISQVIANMHTDNH